MCLSWFGLGLPPRTPRQIKEDQEFIDALKKIKTLRIYSNGFGSRISMDAEELRPELEKLHARRKDTR